MRDVKDMIGASMCVLDGAEISENEIVDLAFDADGELPDALTKRYWNLRTIANGGLRTATSIRKPGRHCRRVLNEIVRLSMRNPDDARLVLQRLVAAPRVVWGIVRGKRSRSTKSSPARRPESEFGERSIAVRLQ